MNNLRKTVNKKRKKHKKIKKSNQKKNWKKHKIWTFSPKTLETNRDFS